MQNYRLRAHEVQGLQASFGLTIVGVLARCKSSVPGVQITVGQVGLDRESICPEWTIRRVELDVK